MSPLLAIVALALAIGLVLESLFIRSTVLETFGSILILIVCALILSSIV